jgi:hypothetical protein
MADARLILMLGLGLSLAGCGTYVPEIQEFPGDDVSAALLVHAIVDSIHCEIRNAITTVIDNDNEASKHNQGVHYAAYLYDWGAQIGLTLQVEEKSGVSPSVNWLPRPFGTTIFNLSAGGTLSADATRIDKLNYYYTVRELYALGSCPRNFNPPHPTGSLLIQSDLKLAEWLSAQVLEVETGAFGPPINPNSVLKQNALSHEVKFEVVSTGSLTPAWKLTRFTINQTGPFLSA